MLSLCDCFVHSLEMLLCGSLSRLMGGQRACMMFFFLMIRRPPRSTLDRSSAASDVYKRQGDDHAAKTATAIHQDAKIGVEVQAVTRGIDDILEIKKNGYILRFGDCLLYTSDAAASDLV